MSGRAGVELTPTVLRVVRTAPYTGRVTETLEIPWDPERPLEAIAVLRARTGRPSSVSLAIGLGFLQVMRVDLPPVSPAEQARIVELEPQRYFAAAGREALVVTLSPDAPIAFGASASMVAGWITAFETWAPVEWLEPAPVAVARVLGAQRDGAWRVDAGTGETGVMQTSDGRITSVRRTTDPAAGSAARAIPAFGTTPAAFAAALGAAQWRPHHGRGAPALAPATWRRRLVGRQRATTAVSAIAMVVSILFTAWAADRWRERTLTALDERVAQAESQAAPADTALRKLRSREAEAATIQQVAATRADPFVALAVISSAMPREATILSARAHGNDWQVDGTTADASVLVPLLDKQERFDSVRFLTASSRYRDGNRTYETFSIALRFRPRP